jgi:hypothetical protein
VIVAQDETLHRLVEARIASRRHIRLRALAREYRLLGLPDGAYDGRIAAIVPVDTHPQVDFPRVRIASEGGHEAQDGIGGQAFQSLEHG